MSAYPPQVDPDREFDLLPGENAEELPTDQWSLCLSGGGFRAMLFHTGALWRLFETGVLSRISFFSSVSGGSITNAWLALKWGELSAPNADFESIFVSGMRAMARQQIDVFAVLRGLVCGGVSKQVAAAYDRVLFAGARLQSLPDQPRFIFTASNLQSGALWRFSKPYMGDYKIGRILTPDFPVSAAVAASSAFPPFLSPLVLRLPADGYVPSEPSDEFSNPVFRSRVVLADGGVYDNLGLEPIIKRTRKILVSDGGMPFAATPRPSNLWSCQILRVLDCEDNQVRSLRKRDLISRFQIYSDMVEAGLDVSSRPGYREVPRTGTYWGINTAVANYPTAPGLACPPDLTTRLANISTRLWRMAEDDQERVINWGYAVSDYALRAHVDPALSPAQRWPYSRGLS
jgi:NTE family protein